MRSTLLLAVSLVLALLSILGPSPALAQDKPEFVEPFQAAALPVRLRATQDPAGIISGSGTTLKIGATTLLVGVVGVVASIVMVSSDDGFTSVSGIVLGVAFAAVAATGAVITVVGVRDLARKRGARLRISPAGAVFEGRF